MHKIVIGRGGSLNDGAGYLFSDNRASGGSLQEADVLTCSHCQRLLVGKNWREDGGFCHSCFAPVCGPCCDRIPLALDQGGGCTPFVKIVDDEIRKHYHWMQNAKILGI